MMCSAGSLNFQACIVNITNIMELHPKSIQKINLTGAQATLLIANQTKSGFLYRRFIL